MNSRDYSLPQDGSRVYIVGVCRQKLLPGRMMRVPPHHPATPLFPNWLVPHQVTPQLLKEMPDRLRQKEREAGLEDLDKRECRSTHCWVWHGH